MREWILAKEKAKESGLVVFDVNKLEDFGIGCCMSTGDRDDFDSYIGTDGFDNNKMLKELEDKVLKFGGVERLNHEQRDKYEKEKEKIIGEVNVPRHRRSIASYKGEHAYRYSGRGGYSWVVPYVAGMYTLALQVNPKLTEDEFFDMVKKSSVVNKKGSRIINPKGIIDEVKGRLLQ